MTFDVASQSRQGPAGDTGRTSWTGGIETKRLAARIGGESVAWDEPLKLTFALAHEKGRIEIENLECQSEFVQVTGRGNSDGAHFEARCDLSRLAARLGQFFKTDSQEIRGVGRLTVDLKRDAEGIPVVDAKANIDDLLIRRLVTSMVDRRARRHRTGRFCRAASRPRDLCPPPRVLPPPGTAARQEVPTKMAACENPSRVANREAPPRRTGNPPACEDEVVRESPVTEWKTILSEPKSDPRRQRAIRRRNQARRIDESGGDRRWNAPHRGRSTIGSFLAQHDRPEVEEARVR